MQWQYDETKMLFPNPKGITNPNELKNIRGYHLFQEFEWPSNGYWHVHGQWGATYDLPKGYDYYVLSWQMEHIDFDWLRRQEFAVPVFVLTDLKSYNDFEWPNNVTHIRWLYWHYALDQMIQLFGTQYKKNIQYKTSAFCNRITQNKLLVTTAMLELLGQENCLVSISDWLEDKNVHHWQSTGRPLLDVLMRTFQQKYLGHRVTMDDFTNDQNFQHYTANPTQIAYQQAAIHFTNESFHYSLMQEEDRKYILPGPHLSEKTFKCLLGGTAFIPVGQYDVYRTLSDLGMKFEYGLDLSFDQEPGNLDRLSQIVSLIQKISQYSAQELYEMTRTSSEYNQELVISGEFYRTCETLNIEALEKIKKCLTL